MKLAIVGSRDFSNLKAVADYVATLPNDTIIISGGARGVDTAVEDAAKKRGLITEIYPADWNRYGKQAGMIRNAEMVRVCDKLTAFWDGQSRGTKHSIELAEKAHKLQCIFREIES